MRSPPPGNEMKAQLAPVSFMSNCRMTLSRLVMEPPDCFICPGFFFAASMKSFSVLNGESALTAISAGSSTSRTTGVMSFTVTFASDCVSGFVTQTLVKTAIACASPFFSTT
jgi:hypothetical protein